MLQPELSLPPAASLELPVKKVWLTPPTTTAVPVPRDGLMLPVLVLASGGRLLKFHWAITAADKFVGSEKTHQKAISKRNNEPFRWLGQSEQRMSAAFESFMECADHNKGPFRSRS